MTKAELQERWLDLVNQARESLRIHNEKLLEAFYPDDPIPLGADPIWQPRELGLTGAIVRDMGGRILAWAPSPSMLNEMLPDLPAREMRNLMERIWLAML